MVTKCARIKYDGSYFWLILWTLIYFPIAIALLFAKSSFKLNEKTYTFAYDGSRFWLCFWVLFFFPIALLLIFLNGYSISVKTHEREEEQSAEKE